MEFFQQLMAGPVFSWVILPLIIFACKILDVTVGTLRIIFVSRGLKFVAPLLGFVEVSIWLLAISQIMQNLNNPACLIAYAGGFAMGNYVGIMIEEKLALGTLVIRVFLVNDKTVMKARLYEAGFGVTSIDAHGMNGNVEIIYTIIKRKNLTKALSIIEQCQSNAFYSIEDAKSVRQGVFPADEKCASSAFRALKEKHYRRHGK